MTRKAEILAGGLSFGEGPRWHDGRLWFSDFFDHAVKSVSLAGDVRVELSLDDQPSGLGWAPNGDMLVVSMTKRRLLRVSADGSISTQADLSDIATWHCNDMAVDAQGRAYVGNFGFDLDAAMGARGFEGVVANHTTARLAMVADDGTVTVVAEDLHFPNGTVITPDGRTLIVGETFAMRLTAFDIAGDGRLSNRREWAPLGTRLPDGICLDAEGAVWVANPGAPECVRVAQGGRVLEVVETSRPCFACMLGGDDGRTLFMMTSQGDEAGGKPKGWIETVAVEAGHAGRP
jgi:sugar lactone lactonase YvrE